MDLTKAQARSLALTIRFEPLFHQEARLIASNPNEEAALHQEINQALDKVKAVYNAYAPKGEPALHQLGAVTIPTTVTTGGQHGPLRHEAE